MVKNSIYNWLALLASTDFMVQRSEQIISFIDWTICVNLQRHLISGFYFFLDRNDEKVIIKKDNTKKNIK